MVIRKLPQLLVNQIAAGEVIERPASVVKELVENSLDAGATRLDITVQDGGRELIRIADNGRGISPEQLHLAVAPHATSKLDSAEQLASIATLGFRGEALASIVSVSRLRITSRATLEDHLIAEAGAVIEASGEEVSTPTPAGCAPGTTIEVRDLFFNTPARRKFMRGAAAEFGAITEAVTRIAMAYPLVAFRLTQGTRTPIDTPAVSSRRGRCIDLLGREISDALLEFESSPPVTPAPDPHHASPPPPMAIWGLVGIPAMARPTSKFLHLYVNGRPIRDRHLAHAVKEAYRGLAPPNKYPVAVVMIDIEPTAVDINVHPAKTEVRFQDAGRVYGHVLSAVRQRLLSSDLTPTATFGTPPRQPTEPLDEASDTARASGVATAMTAGPTTPSQEEFVNYFKQRAPTEKGFDFSQAKQALAQTPNEAHPASPDGAGRDPAIQQAAAPSSHRPEIDPATTPEPGPVLSTEDSTASPQPRDILQVHDSYLVTQDDQGLIIIDQHALHERVMFEELRARVLGASAKLESQRMLMPAIIKATPKRQALLDELKPLTQRIGIEADPIGDQEIAIHAFPSFLFDRKVDPAAFLEELLDQAEEGQFDALPGSDDPPNDPDTDLAEEAALHKALDMMACKAAVKAGDSLSREEMAALLDKCEQIERSSSCPHGRPTTIRLTLRDMEKYFNRT